MGIDLAAEEARVAGVPVSLESPPRRMGNALSLGASIGTSAELGGRGGVGRVWNQSMGPRMWARR